MRTYLDCIPCFFKQALQSARLISGDETVHKKILNDLSRLVPEFSLCSSPPEMSRHIQRTMEKYFGEVDLYKEIKRKSNSMALELYPRLKEKVRQSDDKLLTAIEVAIAGNVIDYAVKNTLNIEEEISRLLDEDRETTLFQSPDYQNFKEDFVRAKTIVYLADNAGEILFDRVLIEEFPEDKKIFFAVRGKPVINDALIEDAQMCGLDTVADVISTGVDAPGTLLRLCSQDFLEIFHSADMIISKGQGNYEALSDSPRRVYFLLKVKCPVIARHCGAEVGDIILKRRR